ncbi:MAG: cytochrome family protein, partial [Pedosphaera sp.]|nr:cytochrome family protein [Pedosphaera sp.]
MRKPKAVCLQFLAGLALSTGAVTLLLLVNSCSTVDRAAVEPLQIEGATYVGDKACLDCHEKINRAFPASPHARLHSDNTGMAGWGGCESCHGPASKHVASGAGKFIINPGKDPQACFRCHL